MNYQPAIDQFTRKLLEMAHDSCLGHARYNAQSVTVATLATQARRHWYVWRDGLIAEWAAQIFEFELTEKTIRLIAKTLLSDDDADPAQTAAWRLATLRWCILSAMLEWPPAPTDSGAALWLAEEQGSIQLKLW